MTKSTEDMKHDIEIFLQKMNGIVDDKYKINNISNMYFSPVYNDSVPGMYVFSDEKGYHFAAVGDRGGIDEDKISEDIDDIYFTICENLSFDIAMNYARDHREKGKDWRRIIFSKQLAILSQISDNYHNKGKKMISDILKESPYDDKLFD